VTETLRYIRSAWKNISYAERDTRSWSMNKEIPYQQWLADRVKEVKLPYKLISQEPLEKFIPEEPTPDTRAKKIQKLKEEVERLKRKNDTLNNDMQSLQHDYLNVKAECEAKTKANERLIKRQKVDREYIMEMTQELTVTKAELTSRAREREVAVLSERQ